tara:strand:+ start:1386 stop:1706 length:321 start_codon:yes stop_codon:yes gene_type:complete
MTTFLLSFLCVVLAIVVGVLLWYIRRLISSLNDMYVLIKETLGALNEYEEHLEKVYSMDTFYGDSTLEGLLEHSRDLKKGLEEIVRIIQSFFDERAQEEEPDAEEA